MTLPTKGAADEPPNGPYLLPMLASNRALSNLPRPEVLPDLLLEGLMSRPIAIQARLNQAEADTIKAAAAAHGLNVGSWLRMVALEAATWSEPR